MRKIFCITMLMLATPIFSLDSDDDSGYYNNSPWSSDDDNVSQNSDQQEMTEEEKTFAADLAQAIKEGNLQFFSNLLKENLDFVLKFLNQSVTENGHTILQDACINNNLRFAQYLIEEIGINLNTQNQFGDTALHIAAHRGNFQFVNYLLDRPEIDVNILNNYNETALHLLFDQCPTNETNFIQTFRNSYLTVFKYLIQHTPLNVNAQDMRGNTVLHLASSCNLISVVKYLLSDTHINTTIKNKGNQTALVIAENKGYSEIVNCLKEWNTHKRTLNSSSSEQGVSKKSREDL